MGSTTDTTKDVSVTINWSLPTVAIKDRTGRHENIFMQGDDAVVFVEEFNHAIETASEDALLADMLNNLTRPYTDGAWR
jgi:hypothetical protein